MVVVCYEVLVIIVCFRLFLNDDYGTKVIVFGKFCRKRGPLSINAIFYSKLSKNGFYTEGSYFLKIFFRI
jgi:hypothetical protein